MTYVAERTDGTGGGQIGHLLLQHKAGFGWTTEGRPLPFETLRDLLVSLPYGLKLRPMPANGTANASTTASPALAALTSASSAQIAAAELLAAQRAQLARQQLELAAQQQVRLSACVCLSVCLCMCVCVSVCVCVCECVF